MSYPIITICGSMRYFKAMLAIAESETVKGHIVLMPFVHKDSMIAPPAEELDKMHRAKIEMSDGIVVVGSHIGESTQTEINYAHLTGKGIVRYTEVDHLL